MCTLENGGLDVRFPSRKLHRQAARAAAGSAAAAAAAADAATPLAVPKKSKLFIEFAKRERENAQAMYHTFQQCAAPHMKDCASGPNSVSCQCTLDRFTSNRAFPHAVRVAVAPRWLHECGASRIAWECVSSSRRSREQVHPSFGNFGKESACIPGFQMYMLPSLGTGGAGWRRRFEVIRGRFPGSTPWLAAPIIRSCQDVNGIWWMRALVSLGGAHSPRLVPTNDGNGCVVFHDGSGFLPSRSQAHTAMP